MADVRDETELAWRDAPGTVPRWARFAIVCACAATIAIPAIGCRMLWRQVITQPPLDQLAFENVLAFLAAAAMAIAAAPRTRVACSLQLAVLLPAIHVGLIALAWPLWRLCSPSLLEHDRYLAIATAIPLGKDTVALAAIGLGWAYAVARRRRDTHWSHAFALFGLVLLLALGLWLPIASRIACSGEYHWAIDPRTVLEQPRELAGWVIAPPLAIALAYTWFAIRRPDLVAARRRTFAGVLVIAFMLAVMLRLDATVADAMVYGNFIPVMLATALVACGGLVGLVTVAAIRDRALRRRLAGSTRGTIVGGVTVSAGALEIAGWLRAPRTVVQPFVLATAEGKLPIPGAELALATPPETTVLHVGEAIAVVRGGDHVMVAGLTRADASGPFRTLAGWFAGDDVVVARADLPPASFADVALRAWRPCVAYLGILVAITVPALAAALAAMPG